MRTFLSSLFFRFNDEQKETTPIQEADNVEEPAPLKYSELKESLAEKAKLLEMQKEDTIKRLLKVAKDELMETFTESIKELEPTSHTLYIHGCSNIEYRRLCAMFLSVVYDLLEKFSPDDRPYIGLKVRYSVVRDVVIIPTQLVISDMPIDPVYGTDSDDEYCALGSFTLANTLEIGKR